MKLVESFKKHRTGFLIVTIVSLVIGITIFLLFFFVIRSQTIVGAVDGAGVAGLALLAVFGLAWLSRAGAFDTISYGFGQMFTSMFARKANKYNDFADYKEQKNTKREVASLSYFCYLFVGILFLIAFGVLEIVYHSLY